MHAIVAVVSKQCTSCINMPSRCEFQKQTHITIRSYSEAHASHYLFLHFAHPKHQMSAGQKEAVVTLTCKLLKMMKKTNIQRCR